MTSTIFALIFCTNITGIPQTCYKASPTTFESLEECKAWHKNSPYYKRDTSPDGEYTCMSKSVSVWSKED